ncbi:ATP-binding protein [Caldimonas tepidiphila]|uniref:hybrid sensor histidine kinase/response regulator n=1 Tax=Caldimonas tepidiphila TaxID=2315841 RepID=UPI000E5BB6C1|nr:ATP-binding protein [Caldimonas tepidiphila]
MPQLPLSAYETLFRRSSVGGYLLSPNPDFIILDVNDAFLAATARTRAELLGRPLFDAFSASPSDDSGVVALRTSLLKVLSSREADALPVQRYPIKVRTADGEERFEERFWSAVNSPILHADGQLACIAHSTIDVTELVKLKAQARADEATLARSDAAMFNNAQLFREVNRALEAERARLRHLFDHAPGFVYFTRGPDHVIDQANDALSELAAHRPLAGRTMREAFPEVEGQGYLELHDEVYRSGVPKILRSQPVRLQSGTAASLEERYIDLVLEPIVDEHGRVVGICGQGNDITEKRRAEEGLREASRRKDEFLATLAHELRNPLAPIRTGVQILRLRPEVSQAAHRTLETMERQIAHMVRLVDDLLDVSRISVGKVELRREMVSVRSVVDSAIEAIRPSIEGGDHELVLRLPDNTLCVHGDATRLAQVIGNLLHNAARYTPRGGRIELSVRRAGDEAVIEVRDNGIGIPPDMLSRVFEMFTQVRQNALPAQGGLGIGLSLARQLVGLHQGRIEAESGGPGTGALFRVTLPLAHAGAASGPAGDTKVVPDAAPACPTVLVVDDNVDAADSLAAMLELLGHETRIAYGGQEALEIARQWLPRCVFCDIGMPGMDGYEVARRLRADAQIRDTVLVALTGWGSAEDRRRAQQAGFDRHLTKPVDLAHVRQILGELCDRGGAA